MLLRVSDLYIRVWSSLTPLGFAILLVELFSCRRRIPCCSCCPRARSASRALAIGALWSALCGPLGVGDLLSMAVPPVFFGRARRS